jgi:thymidylate kinase/predicted NUDIX family phosphoesterase
MSCIPRPAHTARPFDGLFPPVSAPSTPTAGHELAQRARDLLPILRRQARRPYIVELAGTPKAGKTTALHVLQRFLKDCGYHVQEMRERAAECPITMKGHFLFNTWTTTTMLASVIESLESEADVLLLDRGVFDAIVWLEAQSLEHQVTVEEYRMFREFVLLERWRKLTDLTFVFTVAPETALRRENKDLLIQRTGSIMQAGRLERYNRVLGRVRESVRNEFTFVDVDTSEHDSPQATVTAIATALLEHMSGWADPEIAAIPRAVAEDLFRAGAVRPLPEAIEGVQRALVFRRRSELERDDGFVQLVGAAVLRHADKLLVLRRDAESDEKIEAFGRDVLWKGCHLPRSPTGTAELLATTAAAIKARLEEDFHLARFESEPIPRMLVWNASDPGDARHLGVFFDVEIPTPEVAQSLAEKVFKRERNRTKLRGKQFMTPAELHAQVERKDIQLESWSREVLGHMMAARS